jgi:Gp157 protein
MATIHEFPAAAEVDALEAELEALALSGGDIGAGDFGEAASLELGALDVAEVSRPLYVLEEEIGILLDSAGLEGAAEQPEVFLNDFAMALRAAVAKRDAIAQFMAHLEAQIATANKEIARLSERRETYTEALERVEGYVLHVLESIGRDGRGRPPRLEGATATLTLRGCPGSVNVLDEEAVPAAFKLVTATLPAELWEEVLDALELDLRARVEEATGGVRARVSLSAVQRAIKAGVKVDGTEMRLGKNKLVRK